MARVNISRLPSAAQKGAQESRTEKLMASASSLMAVLEPDPRRSGLAETPARVAKYLEEITTGYDADPAEIIKLFEDGAENVDQLVFQGSIPFHSLCEHHMAPFFGVAHIGYVPNGRVLGLSKFARLLDIFAKRLQVQERLTNQVADALLRGMSPLGVGVVIRARHMCMESRGVKKIGTITYTSALRGSIKDIPEARAEFMDFVKLADQQAVAI